MYTLSPYMNCSFKCSYCDGRAEKYHLDGDFGKNIIVRRNLPELLEKELSQLREIAPIHLSSGFSDVYQHAEKKYNLTGRCSEILSQNKFNVSVLTKSSLILRDIDKWDKVNKNGGFTLQLSFTTINEDIRKVIEPNASSVSERLETIKSFKDIGCKVGIYMMPLLPGITDNPIDIRRTLDSLTELKVDYIMPSFLTLRPGRQKNHYISVINKNYPELINKYKFLYKESRESGVPLKSYQTDIYNNVANLMNGIDYLIPHRIYQGKMPIYCEVLVLLKHMIMLYDGKSIDTKRLKQGFNNLESYFKKEKISFNRKKSLPNNDIDHQFVFLIQTGGLNNIVKNNKLSDFITRVVIDKKLFDYQSLKLI